MIWWLIGVVCAAALAFLLWCLALRPRRGQPGWEALAGRRYAHRGLHDVSAGRPENSLSAFRAAAQAGFGAELDVHLMADGALAVVHDSDLYRVCGKHAVIEQLRREDLAAYPLTGSGETIPLLEDVLTLFEGKGPLIIELKARHDNAAALTDGVMARLEGWAGTYCLESFSPAVVARLKKRWPGVIRGQLSSDFLSGGRSGVGWLADFAMTHLLVCAVGRPDFVAYRWEDRDKLALRLSRRLWGTRCAFWTLRDQQTLIAAEKTGALPIFERFVPDGPLREKKPGNMDK